MHGVDVKQDLCSSTIDKIKEAVTQYVDVFACLDFARPMKGMHLTICRHRVVVFRDQGVMSGQQQVNISEWFGPCESTFYKHPKSPHPDIFRVSNNKLEGCTGQHFASDLSWDVKLPLGRLSIDQVAF